MVLLSSLTTPTPKECSSIDATKRYRAELASIAPKHLRTTPSIFSNGFFGVSLENEAFAPQKFLASVKWLESHFRKCSILIGDQIHRLTIQFNQRVSPEEAQKAAISLGSAFIEKATPILRSSTRKKFTITRCSNIQATDSWERNFEQIQHLFSADINFRKSIEETASRYISRAIDRHT